MVRPISSGSSRQETRPVAAKRLVIEGQASDSSTRSSVSVRLRTLSSTTMTPLLMRISENDNVGAPTSPPVRTVRASMSIKGDQLE